MPKRRKQSNRTKNLIQRNIKRRKRNADNEPPIDDYDSPEESIDLSHQFQEKINMETNVVKPRIIDGYNIPITDHFINQGKIFDEQCDQLQIEYCENCNRRCFDLMVKNNLCKYCRNSKKKDFFTRSNNMDPGKVPFELSDLTEIEKMLIAQVHPILSLYKYHGQQYKYSGHVINFIQDIESYTEILPINPDKIKDIIIFTKKIDDSTFEFVARAHYLRQALLWLKKHNIYYKNIIISEENLKAYDNNKLDLNKIPVININEEDIELNPNNTIHHSFVPEKINTNCDDIISEKLHLDYPLTLSDPLNEFTTEGLIARAFPALFPYGNGDLNQSRTNTIHKSEYFKFLMQYKDRRFAKDPRFRFYAMNMIMRHEAITNSRFFVKRSIIPKSSSEDIAKMFKDNKKLIKSVYIAGNTIRGTRPFWRNKYYELLSMVTQLGSPNLFFTLSCADGYWPSLFKLLNPDSNYEDITDFERRQLVIDNPDIVSYYFQKRSQLFIEYVLIPLFGVKDYWYRVEWQNRGSPHNHGLLWLEDAPTLDKDKLSDDIIEKFCKYYDNFSIAINIDRRKYYPHPSTLRFSEIDESNFKQDLTNLINTFQRHTKCGQHCARKINNIKTCRYKFPKELLDKSKIECLDGGLVFHPKRNDELLQRYNPYITMIWRANTDVTAVLSIHAVLSYIAKYVAKEEKSSNTFKDITTQLNAKELQNEKVSKIIMNYLMNLISERDYSAQEVHHLLMGYPLTNCSRNFVVLMVPEDESIELKNENNLLVTKENKLLSTYSNRKSYKNMTLLEFAKKINIRGKKLHAARIENIVRIIPKLEKKEDGSNNELWYRRQCILHIPFEGSYNNLKNINKVIKTNKLWQTIYNHYKLKISDDKVPELINDDVTLQPNDDGIRRTTFEINSTYGIKPKLSSLGKMAKDLSHNWIQESGKYVNIEKIEEFLKSYQNYILPTPTENKSNIIFTHEQKEVLKVIDKQILHIKSKENTKDVLLNPDNTVPRRIVIQGKAGSGKSTLIHEIVRRIKKNFGEESVLTAAPTGAAAVNIHGTTIHSSFRLKLHGQYEPLTGECCRKFETENENRLFIIIDEMSMLGSRRLNDIHNRCLEMKPGIKGPFANMFIILVGDFNQLPPVLDTPLYNTKTKCEYSLKGQAMFKTFNKFFELSTSKRQGNDSRFADLCDRLACQQLTKEDYDLLTTRKLVTISTAEKKKFYTAIRLFATNADVDSFNESLLKKNLNPVAHLPSKTEPNIAISEDPIETVLPQNLHIFIGCRVMLRDNVWTKGGLINGSLGTVTGIVYDKDTILPDLPEYVLVKFDNYKGPTIDGSFPIKKIQRTWIHGNLKMTRIQFPLKVAYSSTIHKSQGLTLNQIVIDLSPKTSANSLAYTGITRVKTINDLLISNLPSLNDLNKVINNANYEMKNKFMKKIKSNKFHEL